MDAAPDAVHLQMAKEKNVYLFSLLRYPKHVLPPACTYTGMTAHSFHDKNIRTDQETKSQQLAQVAEIRPV